MSAGGIRATCPAPMDKEPSPPPGAPDHSTPQLAFVVLGLVFLLMTLSRGMGETFTVFLLPISNTFGWDRAQTVSVYSIGALCVGLAGPFVGRLFDHSGPRAVYAIGVVLIGAGFSIAAFAQAAMAAAAVHRARGRPRQRVPRSGDRFAAGQPLVRPAPAHRAGDRRIVDGRGRPAACPPHPNPCRLHRLARRLSASSAP